MTFTPARILTLITIGPLAWFLTMLVFLVSGADMSATSEIRTVTEGGWDR